MTIPFLPHQGMDLNLTANFRGINTSAYLHTNCRSSICGGIEELKSLVVSHFCSKPVAETWFVLHHSCRSELYGPVSGHRSWIHWWLHYEWNCLFFLCTVKASLEASWRVLLPDHYCLHTLLMLDWRTLRCKTKTRRPSQCNQTAALLVEQHLEIRFALFFQRSGELGCAVLGPTCTHATYQLVE